MPAPPIFPFLFRTGTRMGVLVLDVRSPISNNHSVRKISYRKNARFPSRRFTCGLFLSIPYLDKSFDFRTEYEGRVRLHGVPGRHIVRPSELLIENDSCPDWVPDVL